jgi:hypothetical protein
MDCILAKKHAMARLVGPQPLCKSMSDHMQPVKFYVVSYTALSCIWLTHVSSQIIMFLKKKEFYVSLAQCQAHNRHLFLLCCIEPNSTAYFQVNSPG